MWLSLLFFFQRVKEDFWWRKNGYAAVARELLGFAGILPR